MRRLIDQCDHEAYIMLPRVCPRAARRARHGRRPAGHDEPDHSPPPAWRTSSRAAWPPWPTPVTKKKSRRSWRDTRQAIKMDTSRAQAKSFVKNSVHILFVSHVSEYCVYKILKYVNIVHAKYSTFSSPCSKRSRARSSLVPW